MMRAEKQQIPNLKSLVWPNLDSNPRSTGSYRGYSEKVIFIIESLMEVQEHINTVMLQLIFGHITVVVFSNQIKYIPLAYYILYIY